MDVWPSMAMKMHFEATPSTPLKLSYCRNRNIRVCIVPVRWLMHYLVAAGRVSLSNYHSHLMPLLSPQVVPTWQEVEDTFLVEICYGSRQVAPVDLWDVHVAERPASSSMLCLQEEESLMRSMSHTYWWKEDDRGDSSVVVVAPSTSMLPAGNLGHNVPGGAVCDLLDALWHVY